MKTQTSHAAGQRGVAVVVVLAILVLVVAFMAGNTVTLRSLRQELQLIEKQQLRKYQPAPAPRPAGHVAEQADPAQIVVLEAARP